MPGSYDPGGEIRLVDLGPARVSESSTRRPAVVVRNERASSTATRLGRGLVAVVPVTGNTGSLFPFQALVNAAATGLRRDSEAQAEQVRSIAVERGGAVLAQVPGGRHGAAR